MFELPEDRTAQVVIAPVNFKNEAVAVDTLEFTSSDPAVLTVDVNGLVTPVAMGAATITVTADADLTEGVKTIADSIEVTVTAAQAVSLNASIALV